MEEYDTRRSTAVIISHEHTDIVYLSTEQILKSDPVVFDRQMVFNSVCKHERYGQITDLCDQLRTECSISSRQYLIKVSCLFDQVQK